MNKQKNKNEMILKLIKKFPTNTIIYVVNNIIKFLPIVILTHDWEISNDKSFPHRGRSRKTIELILFKAI